MVQERRATRHKTPSHTRTTHAQAPGTGSIKGWRNRRARDARDFAVECGFDHAVCFRIKVGPAVYPLGFRL